MISAFVESPDYVGPVLIFEWKQDSASGAYAVCSDDEGRAIFVIAAHIRFDVRYDWNSHHWVDVNGVTDAEEEPAPDGGAAVP